MPRTTPSLPPDLARMLSDRGSDLRATRRAQGRSAEQVAAAANITRKTLQRVEQGDPAVSLGVYARVVGALAQAGRPSVSRRDPGALDERSLAMHRRIAEKIRARPALLDRARATLERWEAQGASAASRPYREVWRALIDRGLDAVLDAATDPSERGKALRQASPFAGILDNRERWALLKLPR